MNNLVYLVIIFNTKKIIIIFTFIINMPQKINMVISNGNVQQQFIQKQFNNASLASAPMSVNKSPSALQAPMLARVHNVRPGCGSCGRH